MINREGSTASQSEKKGPRHVINWNNGDVMKWLKRHCEEYYGLYGHLFLEHEITGRSLIRISEVTLQRMGISNPQHCDEICRIIFKLKLKSDIPELLDLDKKSEISTPFH